ncbi:hypothetical protein F9L16_04585 [Agarivorans sp. B2Z047]|uniref:RepA family replication protein n=1 Tax=Agarivorans sp. B2Z047 TaxID=2652721 RepID=UPI00128B073C|nr:RepA family replication protein [Agarivorans sp. B2Z047]MPW28276.1 hypothetical protein [Agarivorans sp. B2Z047]
MSSPSNSHTVISKRRRGNHSTRVKNLNPTGKTSDRLSKRPKFIQDIVKASQTRNIAVSDVVQFGIAQLKLYGDRKRGIYADCAKAMTALVTVFSEHINIVTHQVEISLRNASDMAGLTTQAEGGNLVYLERQE